MQRNRLAAETSPYLQQHADNPVDWYPWGDEAFATAAAKNKPILLSVGYSACHWCHVMAHESFADPATAALMNELFVNLKVDREERPDLDKIYQAAHSLITQGPGGWPLTLFLSPEDRQPFFGGTYFPKQARGGLPPFTDILRRVADYFRAHPAEIRAQATQLALALDRLTPTRRSATGSDDVLDTLPLDRARSALELAFEPVFGGFGAAPKFPQPAGIERCLRHWFATSRAVDPDLKSLYMATLTLTRMAEGGIYDQLGGGFSRYSTDAYWMIPHFEKMLSDNGQLLCVYAQAALATGEDLFARVAAETAAWALREMRSPEGAFYSSLDADSAGGEGRFYVWDRAQVKALLPPDEYAALAHRYGLDREPNFDGTWHLHAFEPAGDDAAVRLIDAARARLHAARALRVRPGRDEKILTAWNALMIKGLAVAGRVLKRPDLIDAAISAVDFIRDRLWRDGRLLASCKDGRAYLPAYLDDHAFLVDALLELMQSRWRTQDFDFARLLIEVMLDKFEDADAGGFFFTASDHEKLIHRSKTFGDESLPAGNAVAASVLCRLGYLAGEMRYVDAAERTLTAAGPIADHPQAHMSIIDALEDFLTSSQIVVIRGAPDLAADWARQLGAVYAPARMIFAIPDDAEPLPHALAAKRSGSGILAYVCHGMTCSPAITDLPSLVRRLAGGSLKVQ